MFRKIIKRKRLILAVLGITAAFSLAVGTVRPVLISHLFPTAQTSAAKKQLPIYCVDTKGEKKIAISFDAAWGAGRSGSKNQALFHILYNRRRQ